MACDDGEGTGGRGSIRRGSGEDRGSIRRGSGDRIGRVTGDRLGVVGLG